MRCKDMSCRSEVEPRCAIKAGSHSPNTGSLDGNVAVEQCRAGNTAAGIPVLEKKLRGAGVELPARG